MAPDSLVTEPTREIFTSSVTAGSALDGRQRAILGAARFFSHVILRTCASGARRARAIHLVTEALAVALQASEEVPDVHDELA